ncbi:MAG: hypothetical protein ACFFG0_15265 [Candidatus Thorarchaeota archaeon]
MTIKELKEILEQYPEDTEVEFTYDWFPEFGPSQEEDIIISGVKEYLEFANVLYLH